jgi:hypothetical protein
MTLQEAFTNLENKKALKDAADVKAGNSDALVNERLAEYNAAVARNSADNAAKNAAYWQAIDDKKAAFALSQQAEVDYSQAELDVTAAMSQLRQGPGENPGNTGPIRTA